MKTERKKRTKRELYDKLCRFLSVEEELTGPLQDVREVSRVVRRDGKMYRLRWKPIGNVCRPTFEEFCFAYARDFAEA